MLVKSLVYLAITFVVLRANGIAAETSFSVVDSIQMTRFNVPEGRGNGREAPFSPDGRFVVVVTSRGLFAENEIETTIWLFDAGELRRFIESPKKSDPPLPRPIASLEGAPALRGSGAYEGVISNMHWSPDSRWLYFLGAKEDRKQHLFKVGVNGTSLHLVSLVGQDVGSFDVSQSAVVYTVLQTPETVTDYGANKHASTVLTGKRLTDIILPGSRAVPHNHDVWVLHGNLAAKLVKGASFLGLESAQQIVSISPNGRYLAELRPIESDVPASWSFYEPSPQERDWRINPADPLERSPDNDLSLKQYALIDLDSGKMTVLNAPFALSLGYVDASIARWSSDSSRLLITNTFLPTENPQGGSISNSGRKLFPCTAATIRTSVPGAECISWNRYSLAAPIRLDNASFGATANEVELRFAKSKEAIQQENYRFAVGQWVLSGAPLEHTEGSAAFGKKEGLVVSVREGLNDPPALWVQELNGGQSKELWDPNPRLNHVQIPKASIYRWKDNSGFTWTGGLVKPVGYSPGRRYPLVIQTHGFIESEFITDGIYPTAMAARALASVGIMVLQVGVHNEHLRQHQEAVDQVIGYEAAIHQLDVEGLIDPKHVGVTGFSRTCWYVESALEEKSDLFAAATLADGIDESYMQYLMFSPEYSFFEKELEAVNGGKPFGDDLNRWTQMAASFHTDKIVAPVRIEAIGASSVLQEWEIYSSLRLQRKPVELLYFPNAQHILQTPRERFASEQGNVDWFRFWLQNYEDPDPTKKQQYLRWQYLREMRDGKNSRTSR